MITPADLPLVAYRFSPFAEVIPFEGFDWTGATFTLQARLWRDAPGEPLIDLANAVPIAQGISVSVVTTDGIPTSFVQVRINEATLEPLLLNAGKAGSDVEVPYAMHVTGGGLPKTRILDSTFTIRAGANQA